MRTIIAVLCAASIMGAATITSTSGGGNWNSGATWIGGVAPGSGDDAIIAGPVTVPAGVSITVGKSLAQTPTWKTHFPTTTPYAPTAQATGDGSGCGSATGGSLQAGTYYLRFAWVNSKGETAGSTEAAVTVSSGNIPCVTVGALPAGVTSWSLYVTAAGGAHWSETLYASGITAASYAMSTAQSTGAAEPQLGAGGVRVASGSLTINGTLTVRGDLAVAATGSALTLGAGAVLEFDASQALSPSTTDYQFMPTTGYNQSTTIAANGTSGSPVTIRSNAGGGNVFMSAPFDEHGGTAGTISGLTLSYVNFLRVGTSAFYGFYFGTFGPIVVDHCIFDSTQEWHHANGIDVASNFTLTNNTWKNSLATGAATITSIVVSTVNGGASPNTATVTTATAWPTINSEEGHFRISGVTSDATLNGDWAITSEGKTQNSASSYTLRAANSTPGTYTDVGMTLTGYGNNMVLAQGNGTVTGTRLITGNVFDRWVILLARGVTVTGNVFMVGGRAADCCAASWDGNLWRRIGSNAALTWGDATNSFIMTDEQRVGNPHVLYSNDNATTLNYSYNVFEYTADRTVYDSGDITLTSHGTTIYFNHNIVLPVNTLAAMSFTCGNANDGASYTNGHIYHEHNVCFDSGLYFDEASRTHVSTYKNNIVWRTTPAPVGGSCLTGGVVLQDVSCGGGLAARPVDQILMADYNGKWNTQTTQPTGANAPGYYANLSYTPGVHDVSGDPQFVDYTRNFGTWAASLGCTGSTYQAKVACGLTRVQARNEAGYDSRYTVANALAWIRAGFQPQNAAYLTAADDGAALGAWQPVVVPPTPPAVGLTMKGVTITGIIGQ